MSEPQVGIIMGSQSDWATMRHAAEALDAFPDGAAFVPLASLTAPEEIVPEVARALHAPGDLGAEALSGLADLVRTKRLLLVLDNAEHLAAGTAETVARLLEAAPGLTVLVTSRLPLRLKAEREWPLGMLSVPPAFPPPSAARLREHDATRLFLARADAVKPGFAATDDTAPDIAAICRRVDGLPLAIELAAAQADGMSVRAIAELLGRSGIDALETGRRDVHRRLRSMDRAVRWSYDLLEERDRRLLRVLSVFRGGADVGLLAEMCGRLGEPELARSLPRLMQASLATETGDGGDGFRVAMLSPIRLFAEGELAARGETAAVEAAHRATMVGHARAAFARMVGPEALAGLAAMDRERDNLTVALDRAIRAADAHDALALAGSMSIWWEVRGEVAEGFRWLERALALDSAAAYPEDVSQAGRVAAMLAVFLGRPDRWKAVAEEMLRVAAAAEHEPGVAIALTWLGDHAWYVDGDEATARACHERAVEIMDRPGESMEQAQAFDRMGDYLLEHGDAAAGLALLERSTAVRRRLGNEIYLALSLVLRAVALAKLERLEEAREGFLEAGNLADRMRHPTPMIFALIRIAGIDAAGPDAVRRELAPLLLGAAEALMARHRIDIDLMLVPVREQALSDLADALGEAERDRLLAEGRGLSGHEALELAGAGA